MAIGRLIPHPRAIHRKSPDRLGKILIASTGGQVSYSGPATIDQCVGVKSSGRSWNGAAEGVRSE